MKAHLEFFSFSVVYLSFVDRCGGMHDIALAIFAYMQRKKMPTSAVQFQTFDFPIWFWREVMNDREGLDGGKMNGVRLTLILDFLSPPRLVKLYNFYFRFSYRILEGV
jgi:hypothetical protein